MSLPNLSGFVGNMAPKKLTFF